MKRRTDKNQNNRKNTTVWIKKLIFAPVFLILFVVFPLIVHGATITIPINSAFSFQDEGTSEDDVTIVVSAVDSSLAPNTIGTVTANYYATGGSDVYFDAATLNFDISSVGYNNVASATLRFYAQRGSYHEYNWEHYLVQEGYKNSGYEDSSPGSFCTDLYPGGERNAGYNFGWVEETISLDWITDNDFDVTLRLWNIRLDKVELEVTPVPLPSALLLLGSGLIGLIGSKKRFGNK